MQKFVKEKYNQERFPLITYNEFIIIINDYNENHEKNIFKLSDNEYNIDNLIHNENEENDFSSSN